MNTLQIKCEKPIPTMCGLHYEGIAFDGCYFYITQPALCQIIKYDRCFCKMNSYTTQKPYSCICYDCKDKCFWAASENFSCRLFKLDTDFCEIDSISVYVDCDCGTNITGVSYDCKNDHLLTAFTNCIISVDKSSVIPPEILQKSCKTWNQAILSISPDYMVAVIQKGKQSICIYGSEGQLKYKFDVPQGYSIESLLFYPCCSPKYVFYILATKHGCYPYLLKWEPDCADLEIDPCHFLICENRPRPEPACACNDIIESIALIETALSHILNAEGEKLQKVIAKTDDIDKILCVNKAVNKMVTDVTHLEIVLHDKLSTITSICPSCEDCCEPIDCLPICLDCCNPDDCFSCCEDPMP